MTTAIYPGSFDPVTYGHLDIIKRAAKISDRLVVGVLRNSEKVPMFSEQERVEMIRECIEALGLQNVEVKTFSGLTVDFARSLGASFLVRGLRAVTDFEYELQLSQINQKLDPEIDTVFFTTNLKYAYLSSSIVKEISRYRGDISEFVPENVARRIYDNQKKE